MSELLELVTVGNAQKMLGGCTYQHVANLIARGALVEHWAFNRRLVTRASIEAYLAQQGEHHAEEIEA
jgi:hypothetical protein